jgi:hypothetical protein
MRPTQYSTPACDGRGRRPGRSESPQWSVSGHFTDLRRRRHDCPVQPAQRNHQKKPASTHTHNPTSASVFLSTSQSDQSRAAPLRWSLRKRECSSGTETTKAQAEPNGFRRGAHERPQQRHVVGECRGGGRRHTRLQASEHTKPTLNRIASPRTRAQYLLMQHAAHSMQHRSPWRMHSAYDGRPVCLHRGRRQSAALRCAAVNVDRRLQASAGFSPSLGTPTRHGACGASVGAAARTALRRRSRWNSGTNATT